MYGSIYIQMLVVYHHLYQLLHCLPTCSENAVLINICGHSDLTPQRLVFYVPRTGQICMTSEQRACHLNTIQQTGSANDSLKIYLYKLPYQGEKLLKSNYRPSQVLLNQVDITKEEESSTKCLESPTYTDYSNINCSGDHFVSSIDISGLTRTINYLQWSSLIFIYDQFSEARVSRLQLQLSMTGIKSSLMKFDDLYCEHFISGLHAFYITRKDDTNFNIVLICSQQCTATVLRVANGFDEVNGRQTAFHHHSNWLIVSPLISRCELEDIPLFMDNVALFKEFSCSTIEHDPLQKFMKELKYKIELFGRNCDENDPCYEKTPEENRLLIVDYISKFLQDAVDQQKISISTLAWGPNRTRELRHIGYISKDGLVDMEDDIFPNRKYGLNNKTILVSTNPWKPFVMKQILNSSAEYYGFCMDILQELSNNLNFSYVVREPDDKQWGGLINGQWTGLIGDLVTERVDLVVAAISISPDREDVMDFTTPFFYEKSGIGLKMPDPNSTKWKRLLQPLSWQVLLCLGISFISICVIFITMEKNNPYYEIVGNRERYLKIHIPSTISYLWGALLLHGGHSIAQSSSGRIFIGCWWIFCMIMAATYSGNLIAFLTVNKDKPPFSSLDDMLKADGYKWGCLGSSVYETLFKNSKRKDYAKIWNGIVEFNRTDPRVLSLNSEDHLALVKEGSFAYLGEHTPMELWQKDNCDIVINNENFYPMLFGIGLPNASEYTLMFTEKLMKIDESGLLKVWKNKWWPKRTSTSCSFSSTTHQVKAVDLLSLQSMFYVIAIGLFLSCIALTIENIIKIRRKGRNLCACVDLNMSKRRHLKKPHTHHERNTVSNCQADSDVSMN